MLLLRTLLLASVSPTDPPLPPSAFEYLLRGPVQDEVEVPEDPRWTGSVSIGATKTTGNTEITNAAATADAELRREKDRTTVGLYWNYTEEDGEVTQRRTGGKAQYDYFATEKLYYLAQTSAETDKESQLQHRTTLGAGVGYQFREDERWKLAGEAGLTWFTEDYEGEPADDYIAARLAYNAEYKVNDRWLLSQTGEAFPSLEDSDDVYTRLDTRARLTLTEKMFAQAQWVWDWDNTPAEGNERSDHRYILTIGWSF